MRHPSTAPILPSNAASPPKPTAACGSPTKPAIIAPTSLTRWVASAGRQYGAYFSFEPASRVSPDGVVARIYNATASAARGLHYYQNNLFGNEQAGTNFLAQGSQFRQRQPRVEIAVYYPETFIRLEGQHFLGYVEPLRDDFDFDYLSDRQIADGGFAHFKALILLQGNVAEAATWQAMRDWVKQGGWLLRPGDLGKLHTVDGDPWPEAAFSGQGSGAGRGRVFASLSPGKSPQYREFLTHALAHRGTPVSAHPHDAPPGRPGRRPVRHCLRS